MHSFLGAQVATHGRVTFGIHMGLEPCYIAVTVDDLKKVTKMVICGAAMIKKKTMWIKPRLRALQPCQMRRAAPSRSLAPVGAPKAAGAAAIEI